jgi:hypothetical protein
MDAALSGPVKMLDLVFNETSVRELVDARGTLVTMEKIVITMAEVMKVIAGGQREQKFYWRE